MSSYYLASAHIRKDEIEAVAQRIRSLGGTVTSRWHTDDNPAKGRTELDPLIAKVDIEDLMKADQVIVFTGTPSTKGGYHTEVGFAHAFGVGLWVVGPHDNAFQVHWAQATFADADDLIRTIGES